MTSLLWLAVEEGRMEGRRRSVILTLELEDRLRLRSNTLVSLMSELD